MLHKEPEGGYTVTVPALPGCITCGENADEAITMAKDAIDIYLACIIHKRIIWQDISNFLFGTVDFCERYYFWLSKKWSFFR